MFLLNAKAIRWYIDSGDIHIDNADWSGLGPTSYRLRLGRSYREVFVTGGKWGEFEEGKAIPIEPGFIYRIETLETVRLSSRVQGFVFQTTNLSLRGFELIGGVGVEPNYSGKLNFLLRSLWNEQKHFTLGDQIAKIYFFDVAESSCPFDDELYKAFFDWASERAQIMSKGSR
jgi:deoxycytidine triphosphate deaminase